MRKKKMVVVRCALVASVMSASSLAVASLEMTPVTHEEKIFRGTNRNLTQKFIKNATIALRDSCRGKKGETVLVLTDKDPQRVSCAQALEVAALEMGMKPMIMDASAFSNFCHDDSFIHNDQKYPTDKAELQSRIWKPLKAAAETADIVICMRSPGLTLTYANLFGVPHIDDVYRTGDDRRMEYEYTNMENWNITSESVRRLRPRTLWLNERLKTTKVVRITSPAGMDLSVPLHKGVRWYPILGIVPLYAEVAIVPQLGPGMDGVIVVDGSTYRGARPPCETDRQPLRFVMKDGKVTEMSGDPEQVARMKKLDADNSPAGFTLDEVGLVTTDIADNDTHWTSGRFDNGTHSHNCIHIALGKNMSRKGVVHNNLHMDMDILRPTVALDGQVIIKNGIFVDSVWE